MPKVYVFDVDECLEVSNGPVLLKDVRALKEAGHIVGLCGNGRVFTNTVPNWWEYISFTLNMDLGPFCGFTGLIPKHYWMLCFKDMYPHAEEYIMVGNVFGERNSLGHVCGSADSTSAQLAGWRFIKEDNFARGER